MAIFGSGSAKIVSGSTSASLEYSVLTPEWVISDYVEQTSVMNGNRNYIGLGDYSKFKVDVYLYKYSSPKTKFNEIYRYIHKDVIFYPHIDGNTLFSPVGATQSCHITDMKLSYIDNLYYRDLLTITFESKGYVDIASSSLA